MDFTNVKLKKVILEEKKVEEDFDKKYQESIRSVYMDNYFETIKDFTFKTKFIPLNRKQANTIIDFHEKYLKENDFQVTEVMKNEDLKEMLDEINQTLQEYKNVFVKV
jgi:hypothetical protein